MSDMGNRIKQKRTELGLSGEELGKILGVQRAAVSKWESGEVENIKRSTIEAMAKLFKCSPSWLMGFDVSVEVSKPADLMLSEQAKRIAAYYMKLSPASQKAITDLTDLLYEKEKDAD